MDENPANPAEANVADSAEANVVNRPEVIFFGNGPLAEAALAVLEQRAEIIFHARTKEDLAKVAELKRSHPKAYGILASFGVLIRSELLELFEPIGILNLHPSLLPKYRGASPIESAILAGDTTFGYSIMKLAKAMDAGPLYHQAAVPDLPLDKAALYQGLATAGAEWLVDNLANISDHKLTPVEQDETAATFTTKLTKDLSVLHPETTPAAELLRQIIAFQGFPKPKYQFFGKTCIILAAHLVNVADVVCEFSADVVGNSPLVLRCTDRNFVVVDRLQPEGKKPMDAKSFLNGYGKKS